MLLAVSACNSRVNTSICTRTVSQFLNTVAIFFPLPRPLFATTYSRPWQVDPYEKVNFNVSLNTVALIGITKDTGERGWLQKTRGGTLTPLVSPPYTDDLVLFLCYASTLCHGCSAVTAQRARRLYRVIGLLPHYLPRKDRTISR